MSAKNNRPGGFWVMNFGRAVALLMVLLYSLTGIQLLLSLSAPQGAVLGNEDGKKGGHGSATTGTDAINTSDSFEYSLTTTTTGTSDTTTTGTNTTITGTGGATTTTTTTTTETTDDSAAGAAQSETTSTSSTSNGTTTTTGTTGTGTGTGENTSTTGTTGIEKGADEETSTTTGTGGATITVTVTGTITGAEDAANAGSTEASPTIVITPSPTTSTTQTGQTSIGGVVQTVTEVDRSTGETVRQIIRKLGVPAATPTPTMAPTLQVKEKVIEEKTIGEIMSEHPNLFGRVEQAAALIPTRLEYKRVDGKFLFVGKTDTGEIVPISASESASIRQKLERSLALGVMAQASGEFTFTKGQYRAETQLPLLIDLERNQLIAQTTTITKPVLIMPDEAINIAFASNAINGLFPKADSAEIGLSEATDGSLKYEVNGFSKRKVIGLFTVNLPETAYVNAATGQVELSDKSLGRLLVELISPSAR